MAITVNDIFEEALSLPPAHRASLAEKIVESLVADIDPWIERSHLDEIKMRRQQVQSGVVDIVPGDEVLHRTRALIQE